MFSNLSNLHQKCNRGSPFYTTNNHIATYEQNENENENENEIHRAQKKTVISNAVL